MNGRSEEQLQRALTVCFRLLNRRERTVSEIRRHLERQGIDSHAREAAIEVLLDAGYLDDIRYARMLVEDKRTLDGWGSDRIRRTLLQRGVDAETVADALAEAEPAGELDRAISLLQRRFPAPPTEGPERERALAVLLRRGYDTDIALDAISTHTGDRG